jgi:hypothetical protein
MPFDRMARKWKMLVCLMLVVSAAGLAPLCGARPARASEGVGAEGAVGFQWAFGAIVGQGNERKLVPIDRDMVLKSGDELKMLLVPGSNCFIYLIHYDEQGALKLLFPYDLRQLDAGLEVGRDYYIPEGKDWFALDRNTGRETFYLLASPVRLVALEQFLAGYEAAGETKKAEAAGQVIAEIRKVGKDSRQLASRGERPVVIGGNVRGIAKPQEVGVPDIAALAVDISTTGSYAKTFSIEHQ